MKPYRTPPDIIEPTAYPEYRIVHNQRKGEWGYKAQKRCKTSWLSQLFGCKFEWIDLAWDKLGYVYLNSSYKYEQYYELSRAKEHIKTYVQQLDNLNKLNSISAKPVEVGRFDGQGNEII